MKKRRLNKKRLFGAIAILGLVIYLVSRIVNAYTFGLKKPQCTKDFWELKSSIAEVFSVEDPADVTIYRTRSGGEWRYQAYVPKGINPKSIVIKIESVTCQKIVDEQISHTNGNRSKDLYNISYSSFFYNEREGFYILHD